MLLKNKSQRIFLLILLLAAVLRFVNLTEGNAISDEVLYGMRSIDYRDFTFATQQPSTIQLLEGQEPAWTKLSFHDHPPGVFIAQHFFISIFGNNLLGLRLSSVLFGILSVWLIFFLGKALFHCNHGRLAATLMAASALMLYVSRTAVQESQVIFFIILSVFLFWKAQRDNKYYKWFGIAFGLAMLSKYTAIFIIPAILVYLAIYNRAAFKQKYLYISAGLAILVFSPVIIYNLILLNKFGHFDFQLFYIFGQDPIYWQETPGKEIGTVADRFVGIFKNMYAFNSNLINGLSIVAILTAAWVFIKKRQDKALTFLSLLLIFNFLFFLAVGAAPRFLTSLIPWLSILVAWLLMKLPKKISYVAIVLVLGWEIFFGINSYILKEPIGQEKLVYSKIHWDQHDWGYNQLTEKLDSIFENKYPGFTTPYIFEFLNETKQSGIEKRKNKGYEKKNIVIIYDQNMSDLAALWYLDRRGLYEGWPVYNAATLDLGIRDLVKRESENIGPIEFYYIAPRLTLLVSKNRQTLVGPVFKQSLVDQGITPEIIYNDSGVDAFEVYKFGLDQL